MPQFTNSTSTTKQILTVSLVLLLSLNIHTKERLMNGWPGMAYLTSPLSIHVMCEFSLGFSIDFLRTLLPREVQCLSTCIDLLALGRAFTVFFLLTTKIGFKEEYFKIIGEAFLRDYYLTVTFKLCRCEICRV